eukprot:SAG31_NODE_3365_length_4358_cov_2.109650_1_plen_557_part_00
MAPIASIAAVAAVAIARCGDGKAPPVPAYQSILGDPGMLASEVATALYSWNLCDGAAQPKDYGLPPATVRLADCWRNDGLQNRVAAADNALAFGVAKNIPGFDPTDDVELFYRQKEVFLGKLCSTAANIVGGTGRATGGDFNYSGFEIGFKSGIINGAQLGGLCPCSGTPSSCALWDKRKNGNNMNQPVVAHHWSDAVDGAGYFAATWDVEPGWTQNQRQAVLHAVSAHASAWVAYRQAELAHRAMPEPVPPALLVNKSFAFASWAHRNNGSKVYHSGLQTSKATPAIMNYFRINDVSGGYGGYPWNRGFGIMNGPAPSSARMDVTLRVLQAGPTAGRVFMYLPEISGCWKLDGSPCDGNLATDWPRADVTRYLCFMTGPTVTPHCSPHNQKYCPPWHILSADGSKVYRNDTKRFPYSCYYEHCWAPNDPTVPDGEVTCDPFSNPNPQELVQMLPCTEWEMHGFPGTPGVGWIGDARLWKLDVGGLASRVFLQGQEPAPIPVTAGAIPPPSPATGIARSFPGTNRSWISFELGPESPAGHGMVRWEVQDVDVLVPV